MAAVTQPLTTYSDLELALMVLLGYFGNGQTRKNNLGARYTAVQSIVEQILRGSIPAGSGNIKAATIPAGSGNIKAATIERAVRNVFQDCINDIVKEITDEL